MVMAWCAHSALLVLMHALLVCSDDDEIRLVNRLFLERPYNSLVRPTENATKTVEVSVGMELVQIIHVDERNQEMKTNVWLPMNWLDHQLEWDPDDYGGIKIIRLLPYRVWRPDVVLLNNADSQYEVSYSSNVLVSHHGHVTWVPPAIYRSSCTIDVEFFPFDQQVCEIRLGSWTYDVQELTYKWKSSCVVWFNSYCDSGVWYVMDARGQISYDKHSPPKPYVSYKIILRRRVLFYTINLIIPVAMISLLTMTVFYIPVVEGEKVTTGICITVSVAVFFTLLTKLLPPTSLSVPLMSKYLLFTFITNMLAIFVTVVIINWNYRTPGTHRMPKWVHFLFLKLLPKILRMKPPDHIVEEQTRKSEATVRKVSQARDKTAENSAILDGWNSPNMSDGDSSCVEFIFSTPSSILRPRTLFSAQCSDEEDERFNYPHTFRLQSRDYSRSDSGCQRKRSVQSSGEGRKVICFDNRSEDEQVALIKSQAGLKITDPTLRSLARSSVESLNFMIQHLDKDTDYNKVLDEWKFVADVIDRLQLFAFLLVTLFGSIYFLLKTPYLFEDVVQSNIIEKLKNESLFPCAE